MYIYYFNKLIVFFKYLFLLLKIVKKMEINKIKCSSTDHGEINANSYCLECKVYICNKCEIFHSKLFNNHHLFSLEKDIEDIFTGFCKIKNHHEELLFFCKNHNILCCAACICKIKYNELGNHKDCDICLIQDIKEEKINQLILLFYRG